LGSEGVGYSAPADAWITEGGAEMMAFTLLAASDHEYAIAELQRAIDDCLKLATKPIARAADRHESRAFYACGMVFALAASGMARQHGGSDFFDFIKPLLTQHRSDRHLSGAEWLGYFSKLSGDATTTDIMRSMIDQGSGQPVTDIATILRAGNVPISTTQDTITLTATAI
jgi:hypothetical protein